MHASESVESVRLLWHSVVGSSASSTGQALSLLIGTTTGFRLQMDVHPDNGSLGQDDIAVQCVERLVS